MTALLQQLNRRMCQCFGETCYKSNMTSVEFLLDSSINITLSIILHLTTTTIDDLSLSLNITKPFKRYLAITFFDIIPPTFHRHNVANWWSALSEAAISIHCCVYLIFAWCCFSNANHSSLLYLQTSSYNACSRGCTCKPVFFLQYVLRAFTFTETKLWAINITTLQNYAKMQNNSHRPMHAWFNKHLNENFCWLVASKRFSLSLKRYKAEIFGSMVEINTNITYVY